jgi:tRNA pseudouridine13 synthase
MLAGNRFTIAVATGEDISRSVREVYSRSASRTVPNFFGYQRFGLKGMVNHLVGREIVKRDFRQAVKILLATPRRGEGAQGADARSLAREERWREAAQEFSSGQDLERRIASHLAERPDDYLGALRRVPMTTRRLFVQAYQSFIFNRTLSSALASGMDISRPERGDNWAEVTANGLSFGRIHGVREPFVSDGTVALVQLVGYAFRNYGSRFDPLIVGILEEEGVAPSKFYIKEAEELSNEGGFRQAPLLVRDATFDTRESRPTLSFTLGKGEYATTLLREVLKPDDPYLAGF